MLFPVLLAYAAIASAACARRGQLNAGKIALHRAQSPAQDQFSSTTNTTSSAVVSPITTSSTSSPSPAATSPASSPAGAAGNYDSTGQYPGIGSPFTASFTHYSGCSSPAVACGFVSSKTGYSAAISENFFGAAPGAGPGAGCKKCWSLSSSTAGTKAITVQVNNLCPSTGNEAMCAQSGFHGTNTIGMNVNFDLCEDDGTSAAFFGGASVGMATGTATEVAC